MAHCETSVGGPLAQPASVCVVAEAIEEGAVEQDLEARVELLERVHAQLSADLRAALAE